MEKKLYRLKGKIISSEFPLDGEYICDTKDIIPTTGEQSEMVLFKITDNIETEYITSSDGLRALKLFRNKHKPDRVKIHVIGFVKNVITI